MARPARKHEINTNDPVNKLQLIEAYRTIQGWSKGLQDVVRTLRGSLPIVENFDDKLNEVYDQLDELRKLKSDQQKTLDETLLLVAIYLQDNFLSIAEQIEEKARSR